MGFFKIEVELHPNNFEMLYESPGDVEFDVPFNCGNNNVDPFDYDLGNIPGYPTYIVIIASLFTVTFLFKKRRS